MEGNFVLFKQSDQKKSLPEILSPDQKENSSAIFSPELTDIQTQLYWNDLARSDWYANLP